MSDTNDSFAPTRDSEGDASPRTTTVDTATFATWNVLHGRLKPKGRVDLGAFADAAASLRADVLGLQEVDRRQRRSKWADMTALAARHAGGHGRFGPIRRRYDMGLYGNALLSKTELRDVLLLPLPRFSWRNERRAALIARVEASGSTWQVATTHLSLKMDESAEQLSYLLDVMSGRPGARVVLGDLNREPADVEPIAHEQGWTVVPSDPTWPSWEPHKRIDFVLVQNAEVVSSEVRSLDVSDHCALLATLRASP